MPERKKEGDLLLVGAPTLKTSFDIPKVLKDALQQIISDLEEQGQSTSFAELMRVIAYQTLSMETSEIGEALLRYRTANVSDLERALKNRRK